MKFVIHHHTDYPREEAHYDVMIESSDGLITWRVSESAMKEFLEGKEVCTTRIADHRKEYLTYEGPISCDRGMVKIMDSGTCALRFADGTITQYILEGNVLHGTCITQKKRGHTYTFRFVPFDTEKMH